MKPTSPINQSACLHLSLRVWMCLLCVCVWACGSPGSACEEWRQGGPKCFVFRYSSAPRTAVPVRMSSWCLFIPVLYCTVCVSETGWRCSYVREKGDDRDRDRNVLDRDVQMCEGDMHRCVTRGSRGGGRRAGVLSRLASPRDGCRITNQSTPASEREREREREREEEGEGEGEQSDKISGERSCQPGASPASLQTQSPCPAFHTARTDIKQVSHDYAWKSPTLADWMSSEKKKKTNPKCPLLLSLRSVQFLDLGPDRRNQLLFNTYIPNDLNSNKRTELRWKQTFSTQMDG